MRLSLNKGQSGFEYFLVIALSLALVIPLWLFVNSSSNNTTDSFSKSYADTVGSKIAEAADAVYVQGVPAKYSLQLNFPQGISNVSLQNTSSTSGGAIVIRIHTTSGDNDVIKFSIANLSGAISNAQGTHFISVQAMSNPLNNQVYVQLSEAGS